MGLLFLLLQSSHIQITEHDIGAQSCQPNVKLLPMPWLTCNQKGFSFDIHNVLLTHSENFYGTWYNTIDYSFIGGFVQKKALFLASFMLSNLLRLLVTSMM